MANYSCKNFSSAVHPDDDDRQTDDKRQR